MREKDHVPGTQVVQSGVSAGSTRALTAISLQSHIPEKPAKYKFLVDIGST